MQRIIMVVVVLSAVGIVTAFAASQVVPSHQAGAAPPCPGNPSKCTPTPTATAAPTPAPQPRETEITIYAGDRNEITAFSDPTIDRNRQLIINSAKFPLAAQFALEATIYNLAGGTACVELVDITANPTAFPLNGISVADACASGGGANGVAIGRSASFAPPAGDRIYTIRGRDIDNPTAPLLSLARVLVTWEE